MWSAYFVGLHVRCQHAGKLYIENSFMFAAFFSWKGILLGNERGSFPSTRKLFVTGREPSKISYNNFYDARNFLKKNATARLWMKKVREKRDEEGERKKIYTERKGVRGNNEHRLFVLRGTRNIPCIARFRLIGWFSSEVWNTITFLRVLTIGSFTEENVHLKIFLHYNSVVLVEM